MATLEWRGRDLYLKGGRKPLATISPCDRYSKEGMHRVTFDDGERSIPLNLTRARDAAMDYGRSKVNADAKQKRRS